MNEALLAQLTEVVELAKNGVIKTATIVETQIPDIVSQLLKWEFISSIVCGIACLLIFISAVIIFIISVKRLNDSDGWVGGIIFGVVGIVACLPGSIYEFMNAIKICVAPKVYLIGYIQSFLQ